MYRWLFESQINDRENTGIEHGSNIASIAGVTEPEGVGVNLVHELAYTLRGTCFSCSVTFQHSFRSDQQFIILRIPNRFYFRSLCQRREVGNKLTEPQIGICLA